MKHNPVRAKQTGFTITEVMIVLAVAGAIMAIVFLAVPQLGRTQRDTNRKNLAGRLLGSIETYASNNQGLYPFNGTSGTPIAWTDCSTSLAGITCYDWYNNYVSGGKVKLTDPSCSGNSTIYYSNISSPNPAYTTWTCTAGASNIKPGTVYIGVGDICNGTLLAAGQATGSSSSKQFAVLTALDRAGTWNCIDNR